MAEYIEYCKPGLPTIRVKNGFSWPAFFFGFLWAYYHRLWLYGSALLAYNVVLMWTAGSILTASAGSLLFQLVLNIVISVLLGVYSNRILQYDLKRRGYKIS